ncbi:DNA-binding protein, partial [Thiolapillus sp.]
GSYSTISPVLNEWKAQQKTNTTPIQEPAPDTINDRLAAVGAEVWATAMELSNSRLSAEREALEARRTEQEVTQAEAIELADQLADEITELKASRDQYYNKATTAERAAEELRQQLAVAQEQARTAEARAGELRTELDHAHKDANRLRIERDKAQEQANHRAEQIEALRADLATAAATTAQGKKQAAELRKELDRSHQDIEKLRNERDQERTALAKAQAQADTTSQEAKQAIKELAKVQKEAARLGGQLDTYKEQVTALMARIAPSEAKPTKEKCRVNPAPKCQ